MRGTGKRRLSAGEAPCVTPGSSDGAAMATTAQRLSKDGALRRKPIPSTVIEDEPNPRLSGAPIPTQARSSVAKDIARDAGTPSPDIDDTPFIHFALDQLTRDEEVRGSRVYHGLEEINPYTQPTNVSSPSQAKRQADVEEWPHERRGLESEIQEPPARSPQRPGPPPIPPFLPESANRTPNLFVPVTPWEARHPVLDFKPGILKPLQLGLFLALLLAYLACLIFAALWSRVNAGLWKYGSFGDGRYFIFQYLPTILGMIFLFWVFQIEIAIYRIAPFIAMASPSAVSRAAGVRLPLQPPGFFLPHFGHFGARLPVIGIFVFVAWLQLFTIPLLSSSFNAHFFGAPKVGQWRWTATQGVIWVAVALYAILAVVVFTLMLWLHRRTTGLKWDPRSFADYVAILERSNALNVSEADNSGVQIGYWRTTHRPKEIFHTYGIADKPPRSYSIEDGQIREKLPPSEAQRYSDPDMDVEAGRRRPSKEAMLPRSGADQKDDNTSSRRHNSPLPWFLRPAVVILWPITAIVLLLAFLVVSYLPSTRISAGFTPDVPAPVNRLGFSATNFLYSFVPTLLGMLCLLVWLDIDMAYRRLQVLTSLSQDGGEMAERSLLLSYTSDYPLMVTLVALSNKHYRIVLLSMTTLIAASLPILAGGVFWAQFYIPTQTIRISADMPAYYALTALVSLYALAFLLIYPPSALRTANIPIKSFSSFDDMRALIRQSRLLHDLPFRGPSSKTALVTRLLSSSPSGQHAAAASSKISLADSLRGFSRARQMAVMVPPVAGTSSLSQYALGRHQGRDGTPFLGVDRVRS